MLKCLGMERPLGVVGLAAGVLAQDLLRARAQTGRATVQVEFLCAWVMMVPVTPGVGTNVVSSLPLIISAGHFLISKFFTFILPRKGTEWVIVGIHVIATFFLTNF